MEVVFVNESDQLARELAQLRATDEIALDVEGDGLFRYRARLCTVQLATADRIIIVDTLALTSEADVAGLGALFGPAGPIKVIHDASFDARLLREFGMPLGKLFDTSIASRYLGVRSTGLATVLSEELDVSVKKNKQQSDWGRRPLDEASIAYLADDVRYLLPLAERLRQRCLTRGIAEEVAVECAYLLDVVATEEPDGRPPWRRIKGHDGLGPVEQSVLREVAAVREARAEKLDVPPFKVTGNDALMALASKRPTDPKQLDRIRGLSRGRGRRIRRELIDAVQRGISRGRVPEDELPARGGKPQSAAERQRKNKLRKRLLGWREKEAQVRGVDPQVVLPGHCVADIVAAEPADTEELAAIAGFGEVRMRYAEPLLSILVPPLRRPV